jgi:hypothetical protein
MDIVYNIISPARFASPPDPAGSFLSPRPTAHIMPPGKVPRQETRVPRPGRQYLFDY